MKEATLKIMKNWLKKVLKLLELSGKVCKQIADAITLFFLLKGFLE